MTIIEPNKNKLRLNFVATMLIGVILLEALLSVFAYNHSVRLRHSLSQELQSIEELQITNVDLKNQLYAILDLKNADKIATDLGLIKERKPDYLAIQ